jgi:hypothetical protein
MKKKKKLKPNGMPKILILLVRQQIPIGKNELEGAQV